MDLAEFLLASWESAILRMKVDCGPAALDRFKNIMFQTAFSKPNSKSRIRSTSWYFRDCFIAEADGNLQYDWNFGAVRLITSGGLDRAMAIRKTPVLLLISPSGDIVRRWDGCAAPAELGLTLKHYLGSAPGDSGLDITGQNRLER
jgi:hypothetical protein